MNVAVAAHAAAKKHMHKIYLSLSNVCKQSEGLTRRFISGRQQARALCAVYFTYLPPAKLSQVGILILVTAVKCVIGLASNIMISLAVPNTVNHLEVGENVA